MSMFMLLIIFVREYMHGIFLSTRESMQIFFYHLIIYVLTLDTQLSRVEGGDPINWFKSATFLNLSQNHDLDFELNMS